MALKIGYQASMALALPVKYQAPGALGLVPTLPESELPLIITEGDSNKMRLGPVRANLFNTGIDGATLVNYASINYLAWVKQTEYLIMGLYDPILGYIEFKGVKASKRGNDVYAKRLRERFSEIMNLPDLHFFDYKDRSGRHKTRAIFTTLEYNANNLTIGEAWERVGVDYNRLLANLRAKYGDISVVRVWESHKSGYPHIHAIILFNESEFTAFHHNGAWRITEKRDIEGYWPHGFSDIEALCSTRGGLHYIAKYLGKLHSAGIIDGDQGLGPDQDSTLSTLVSRASLLTLSLLWLLRKRAYSISGNWIDEIRALHNSKSDVDYWELVGVDLFGVAPARPVLRWILLGFYSGRLKTGPRLRWSVGLSRPDMREIQASPCYTDNLRF